MYHSIIILYMNTCGKHGGLMVSALDSRSKDLGSSPGQGHCVVC